MNISFALVHLGGEGIFIKTFRKATWSFSSILAFALITPKIKITK